MLVVSFVIIGCTTQQISDVEEVPEAIEKIPEIIEEAEKSEELPEPELTDKELLEVVEESEKEITEEKPTFEQAVWKKRIDAAMAPSYCPPVTKMEYPSSYYQGPLIDSHYHLPSLPDSLPGEEEGEEEIYKQYYGHNYVDEDDGEEEDEGENGLDEEPYLGKDIKMSEIVCTLQHEGTTRNFAFFPFYSEEISPYMLEIVKRTEEQYPDLFTPFTDMPNVPEVPGITSMKAGQMLEQTISVSPGLFQGWGEISLYVLKNGAGRELPPDSAVLQEIYPVIKKNKMMIYFHPGENQRVSFEKILKQYPEINFIVHGDQIKDDIDYLMGKYPNIYFTINNFYANQDIFLLPNGKKDFFEVFENYESLIQADLRAWNKLIEAHPDQVMWGLDRDEEVLWTFDRDVGLKLVDYARAFIGRLDPAVQEKFAYKNAENLLKN